MALFTSTSEYSDGMEKSVTYPDIDASQCVHAHIEQASCEACVQACPKDALILDDEIFGLDSDACDGCGICVPACPQQAITHEYSPELHHHSGRDLAMLACERSGAVGEGVVPCIHAVGIGLWLELHRDGVSMLLYTTGRCADCDRAASSHQLPDLLAHFSEMLHSQGLRGFRFSKYEPVEWQQRRDLMDSGPMGEGQSRRAFLTTLLSQSLQRDWEKATRIEPLVSALPALLSSNDRKRNSSDLPGLLPNVPRLDAGQCTGCDACVHICPHDALAYRAGDGYVISPSMCSGCRMCVDVCPENAMSLVHWTVASGSLVRLDERRCSACGINFHRFAGSDLPAATCHICARKKHHANLYQVLED